MNRLRYWLSLTSDNLFLLLDLVVPRQGGQRDQERLSEVAALDVGAPHSSSQANPKPVLFDDDELWRWNQEQEMLDHQA